jgi:hypothetical protein
MNSLLGVKGIVVNHPREDHLGTKLVRLQQILDTSQATVVTPGTRYSRSETGRRGFAAAF